ncbi:hypothetical protein KAZ57_01370 [Patescibacteria group bacterium]|nr:hypothetical protein [Patescibacteria group bacterium]
MNENLLLTIGNIAALLGMVAVTNILALVIYAASKTIQARINKKITKVELVKSTMVRICVITTAATVGSTLAQQLSPGLGVRQTLWVGFAFAVVTYIFLELVKAVIAKLREVFKGS